MEARFAEEKLGRFMKDFEHQVDMFGAVFFSIALVLLKAARAFYLTCLFV